MHSRAFVIPVAMIKNQPVFYALFRANKQFALGEVKKYTWPI